MKNIIPIIITLAAGVKDPGLPQTNPDKLLQNSLQIAYFAIGITSVIILVIAGINYTISAGNPDKIAKSKNAIIYSIVGIIISMSAYAITTFVLGALE
jgi:hypothetical protein